MVNTNNNHMIIKNCVGKKNHGICEILKFLWYDLFILRYPTVVNIPVVRDMNKLLSS